MNTANIKSYAPRARQDFIQAVTEKAHLLGLSEKQIEPVEIKGDVALIAGRPYPKEIGKIRQDLENRIRQDGFELTMRKMAYTWFNRFVAIRYMELHDYLDHGYRVLSNRTESEIPEIVEHATDVELPGLNKEEIVHLRLAGNKDNELYQLLIVAQCNALSRAMPFLFERIGGYDELLMPDNLLHSNSPVRNLVNDIPEEDWQQIEIIGWIYQFYISEKKDEVIGKVLKSEDIPAATQLFTPNWIVKYMVQNSLGAQWLATHPHSPVKGQMEYYIEPAEQTDEVKEQLAAITPSTINPEELTLIDPASGSGHILVEGYDLFKAIYLERGYRQRDVAQLILEKNLFGLDIDGRAAQLTGFALMMKGRADDRRLFERDVKLNVMAFVNSTSFDAERLAKNVKLMGYGVQLADLIELKDLFEHSTTFGSLIQIPEGLAKKLPALNRLIDAARQDLFVSDAPKGLVPLVQQAEMLAKQYDAVVANPPYMGSKSMMPEVKTFLKEFYGDSKADLFAAFVVRSMHFAKTRGYLGFMTPFVWMFIAAYENLRSYLTQEATITSLIQLEYSGFAGATVPVCSFTLLNWSNKSVAGAYIRLSDFRGPSKQAPKAREAIHDPNCGWLYRVSGKEFKRIPGCPISFWTSEKIRKAFEDHPPISDFSDPKFGLTTRKNDLFVRLWSEVSASNIGLGIDSAKDAFETDLKWFPYDKGGGFRKWYGNNESLVNWQKGGRDIHEYSNLPLTFSGAPVRAKQFYFEPGITWGAITSAKFSIRWDDAGFIPSNAGLKIFSADASLRLRILGLLNSRVAEKLLSSISETLNFDQGVVARAPLAPVGVACEPVIQKCIEFARYDWDNFETSWDFSDMPLLRVGDWEFHPGQSSGQWKGRNLAESWANYAAYCAAAIRSMQALETQNNRLFIDAYRLAEELTPDVPIEQITLTVNPAYRYSSNLTEEEQWTRFRQDTMQEMVSYAIGCMMGRYSLDEPGLIYAHSGNEGFDPSRYTTYPADDDGILPLTDTEWFDDDTAIRLIKFISVAWDAAHLEDNLTFLADNLSPKKNESSRDTIRRYLCDSFFKDHLQTYKKRPIYWLLSSGKQKAFQCLVYLHRYNESTLSRVRSAYVTPLFGNFNARLEYLQNEWDAADSASAKKKFQKEIDDMKKKLTELSTFDDELRHYADKRISLDLDDGVKVNYGKFGNLLAEKKAVTGEK
jgi:type II restriction/modification system DNA methylase subunit YeeA